MLLQLVDKHLEKIFLRKNAAQLAFCFRSSKFVGHIQQLVRQNVHPALAVPLALQIRTEEKGCHCDFSVFRMSHLAMESCPGTFTALADLRNPLVCYLHTVQRWTCHLRSSNVAVQVPIQQSPKTHFALTLCSNPVATRRPYKLAQVSFRDPLIFWVLVCSPNKVKNKFRKHLC